MPTLPDADDLPDRVAEPEPVEEVPSVLRAVSPGSAAKIVDHERQFVGSSRWARRGRSSVILRSTVHCGR